MGDTRWSAADQQSYCRGARSQPFSASENLVFEGKRTKAYEMMSCYEGLLELYKVTGNPLYLSVVEKTVGHIVREEINVAGSGSAFECWYGGKERQTQPTYHRWKLA